MAEGTKAGEAEGESREDRFTRRPLEREGPGVSLGRTGQGGRSPKRHGTQERRGDEREALPHRRRRTSSRGST